MFNDFDKMAVEFFGFSKFQDGLSIKDKRLFVRNKIKVRKQACTVKKFVVRTLSKRYNMF